MGRRRRHRHHQRAGRQRRRREWSGLWITFSAIDKIGHMWGGGAVDTIANYDWTPGTLFEQVHMPWAAKTADDQLGRVIDALKAKDEFNDTLIIVTADHGSTYGGKARLRRQRVRRRQRRRLVRRHVVPRLQHADRAEHASRSRCPQAAHGHRQGRVQLPVHRHRVVAQDWTIARGPTGSPWRGP